MALSSICSAFSSFIVYFAHDRDGIKDVSYWLMGSFAGASWENLRVLFPIVILAFLFFWSQYRNLNLMPVSYTHLEFFDELSNICRFSII